MNVISKQHVHILWTVVACPYTCPAKEEALVGFKTVYLGSCCTCVVHGSKGYVQSAIVADVLTESLLAVNLLAVHYFDVGEIVLQNLRALVVGCFVGLCPPVALVACLVELTSLVVKAVCHLVADDSSYGTIVDGIV